MLIITPARIYVLILVIAVIFWEKIEELELKYSNNINVMASHADFILDDIASALNLYLKAYDLAKEKQDYMNCTYISSSIASLYLTNDDLVNGENWISYLEKDLLNFLR